MNETHPDELRETPDLDAPTDELTVADLRYVIRAQLARGTDRTALREADLEAAYEAVSGTEIDAEPTVPELRYRLVSVLGGVENRDHASAYPLRRAELVALVDELRVDEAE